MTITDFFQQLLNGLSTGSFYALIALGYTMVYGVLRFINFAHGDVFMLGAFSGFYLANGIGESAVASIKKGFSAVHLGFVNGLLDAVHKPLESGFFGLGMQPSFWCVALVTILTMVICATIGIVIEKLAYRPLRSRPKLTVLITAIGVSLFLEYFGQFLFGASPQPFPELISVSALPHTGNLVINSNDLTVFSVTLLLLVALTVIVKYTRMGMAMRAVSNNATAAALMGVNTDTVISFTFGLGSALAGAAGILYSINYPSIDPLMGVLPGVKAFVAAVLGGIGNIPGAALGGLLIGVVETFVKASPYSTYADAIAFAILILILLFKPSGLLGKSQVEKV